MCRLNASCIYNSARGAICSLEGLSINVQKDEYLLAYSLEQYFGDSPLKRPDHLLIGRVGNGPWIVVLAELKSRTGWEDALKKFREVLPALGKGGSAGGEEHHRDCGHVLPLGKDHRVVAIVVGQVGREYRKVRRTDMNRRPLKKGIPWGGKEVTVTPPLFGKEYPSLRAFFVKIGVLPRSG